jgi:hypothetical protein
MGTLCLKEVKRVEIKEHVVDYRYIYLDFKFSSLDAEFATSRKEIQDAYDRLISMGWEPFEELKVPTLHTVKRLRKLKAEYAN